MMILITGQPGNGKSLMAMALMRDEYERNAQAVKQGKEQPRDFYSNVTGATLEENPKAFPWVKKLPEHNDWTKLPTGSYVQYDEAHSDGKTPGLERYGLLFPATGRPGESDDHRVRAMSTHRHGGYDLVFVTQWPNKIHHQVRTLMGKHIHMNRAMGMQRAGVLTWTRTQVDPYDEQQREKAEEEIWAFDKSLYGRYISATLHTSTYKFKVPKKVWSALSMLIVGVIVAWGLYHYLVPASARNKEEVGAAGPPPEKAPLGALAAAAPSLEEVELLPGTGAYMPLQTATVPTLAGVVASERGCRAFSAEGFLIDISEQDCRRLLDKPLPFNVYHDYKAPVHGDRGVGAGAPTDNASPGAVIAKGENTAASFPEVAQVPTTL